MGCIERGRENAEVQEKISFTSDPEPHSPDHAALLSVTPNDLESTLLSFFCSAQVPETRFSVLKCIVANRSSTNCICGSLIGLEVLKEDSAGACTLFNLFVVVIGNINDSGMRRPTAILFQRSSAFPVID